MGTVIQQKPVMASDRMGRGTLLLYGDFALTGLFDRTGHKTQGPGFF